MTIDWAALGSVFGVSLVVTVGLVALFTLGVMGLSRQERAAAEGGSATLAVTGARPVRVGFCTLSSRRSTAS
ncbi:hypothetical protein JHN52_38995 [Streptomyces sp. MBT97]|uniref:hypothetical protein n=1 Tax=Streptomyces sp. MBT97 TaxID=2800411 RepID=UPI0019096B59|nr:hypothetical protein [Streptomyces sp. MBT97]MBK3638729.1 hypothetical protein [Streptomyces sp. MBT97]